MLATISKVRDILISEFGYDRGLYIMGCMATSIVSYAQDGFSPADIIGHLKNNGALELGAHLKK